MKENNSGYELKLTSIGSQFWQLFIGKTDNTSDFVRIVFGTTEQVGAGTRKFNILRQLIITPPLDNDPVFMKEFFGASMKNNRVWAAFETVKSNKGSKGSGIATFIALSPAQSKWRNSVGSTTKLQIKPLNIEHFHRLYNAQEKLNQSTAILLDP